MKILYYWIMLNWYYVLMNKNNKKSLIYSVKYKQYLMKYRNTKKKPGK